MTFLRLNTGLHCACATLPNCTTNS